MSALRVVSHGQFKSRLVPLGVARHHLNGVRAFVERDGHRELAALINDDDLIIESDHRARRGLTGDFNLWGVHHAVLLRREVDDLRLTGNQNCPAGGRRYGGGGRPPAASRENYAQPKDNETQVLLHSAAFNCLPYITSPGQPGILPPLGMTLKYCFILLLSIVCLINRRRANQGYCLHGVGSPNRIKTNKKSPDRLAGAGKFAVDLCGLFFLIQVHDIRRLGAFGGVLDGKLHPLTFLKVPVPLALDGGVVDEHVLLPAVRADEAVALDAAEPLDRTSNASVHVWGFLLAPERE